MPGLNREGVDAVRFQFAGDPAEAATQTLRVRTAAHAARVSCVVDRDTVRRAPFSYHAPLGHRLGLAALLFYGLGNARRNWSSRAHFAPGKPRVLLPADALRLHAAWRLDVLGPAARAAAGALDLVYYPRKVEGTRQLCWAIYDLLRSAPDLLVLGLGLEDFWVDTRSDQPLVDLDEFRLRLEWVLGLALDCGTRAVFVLAPPAGESASRRRRYSERTALPYIEAARALVAAAGGSVVDLQRHYARIGSGSREAAATALGAVLAEELLMIARERPGSRRAEPGSSSPSPVDPGRRRAVAAEFLRQRRPLGRLADTPAENLYLALVPSRGGAGEAEEDEGNAMVAGKVLDRLGGSNEFQRFRQARIVDDLHGRHRPGRKRVMIIGDSIRMRQSNSTGYGLYAYAALKDRANLFHVPHNCGSSSAVLQYLDNWLQCRPQVVHINAGLHDLVFGLRGESAPSYVTAEQYAANVRAILARLRAAGVERILWALNTPVVEAWHNVKGRRFGRRNADIRAYNAAAAQAAREADVEVTDLFTPLWDAGVERTLLADGVHLNPRGAEMLGRSVAAAVERWL
jgi:lysophospholipase L1-like esterase